MIFIVDIDNTICLTENSNYTESIPLKDRIDKINQLYNDHHVIIYFSARGSKSGKDWRELTEKQLDDWGCLHHSLVLGKPHYDVWIDDKATNADLFFEKDRENI